MPINEILQGNPDECKFLIGEYLRDIGAEDQVDLGFGDLTERNEGGQEFYATEFNESRLQLRSKDNVYSIVALKDGKIYEAQLNSDDDVVCGVTGGEGVEENEILYHLATSIQKSKEAQAAKFEQDKDLIKGLLQKNGRDIAAIQADIQAELGFGDLTEKYKEGGKDVFATKFNESGLQLRLKDGALSFVVRVNGNECKVKLNGNGEVVREYIEGVDVNEIFHRCATSIQESKQAAKFEKDKDLIKGLLQKNGRDIAAIQADIQAELGFGDLTEEYKEGGKDVFATEFNESGLQLRLKDGTLSFAVKDDEKEYRVKFGDNGQFLFRTVVGDKKSEGYIVDCCATSIQQSKQAQAAKFAKKFVENLKKNDIERFYLDFDGTVSNTHLFHKYNQELQKSGRVGVKLEDFMLEKIMQPGFDASSVFADLISLKAILEECKNQGIETHILSRNFKSALDEIFKKADIAQFFSSEGEICDRIVGREELQGAKGQYLLGALGSIEKNICMLDDSEATDIKSYLENSGQEGRIVTFGGGDELTPLEGGNWESFDGKAGMNSEKLKKCNDKFEELARQKEAVSSSQEQASSSQGASPDSDFLASDPDSASDSASEAPSSARDSASFGAPSSARDSAFASAPDSASAPASFGAPSSARDSAFASAPDSFGASASEATSSASDPASEDSAFARLEKKLDECKDKLKDFLSLPVKVAASKLGFTKGKDSYSNPQTGNKILKLYPDGDKFFIGIKVDGKRICINKEGENLAAYERRTNMMGRHSHEKIGINSEQVKSAIIAASMNIESAQNFEDAENLRAAQKSEEEGAIANITEILSKDYHEALSELGLEDNPPKTEQRETVPSYGTNGSLSLACFDGVTYFVPSDRNGYRCCLNAEGSALELFKEEVGELVLVAYNTKEYKDIISSLSSKIYSCKKAAKEAEAPSTTTSNPQSAQQLEVGRVTGLI